MSARDLAPAYEAATKKQWTQPIGFVHALFEVAVDALKRAPQRDAKAMVGAIVATNLIPWSQGTVERSESARRSPQKNVQDAAGRRAMAREGRH